MLVMAAMASNSLPFLRNMAEKVMYIKLGRKYLAIAAIPRNFSHVPAQIFRWVLPPTFLVAGAKTREKILAAGFVG